MVSQECKTLGATGASSLNICMVEVWQQREEPLGRDSHLSIRTVHLSLCQVTASGATRFLTCQVAVEEDEEAAKEALMSRHPGCLGAEKPFLW